MRFVWNVRESQFDAWPDSMISWVFAIALDYCELVRSLKLRMVLQIAGAFLFLIGYAFARAAPPYIPSEAMAKAVQAAPDPGLARLGLFELLHPCVPRAPFTAEDLATRVSTLYSMENDVGWLAVTRMGCDQTQCAISAYALIPYSLLIGHAAKPDVCGGQENRDGTSGRRRGADDYFLDSQLPKKSDEVL